MIQNTYCEELSLYIYMTDAADKEKVLLKIQRPNKEWLQYIFDEDVYKQGNITRKIYKPLESLDNWNKWKYEWLINLSKAVLESQSNENLQQIDHVLYFRLIKFLQEKVKSNYSANIQQLNAKVYLVNKMIESPPDDILTKHLITFGYGFETTEPDEIEKMIKKGYDSAILPQPFKVSFHTSMKDYYAKIPKAINFRLYLYFIPTLIVLLILIVAGFYTRAISQRAFHNNQLLKKRLADLDIQLKTENEKIIQQYKNELAEKEREYLKTTSKVLEDLWQLLSERIISVSAKLPISKIKELVESIGNKINGTMIEIVRKRLNEILQNNNTGLDLHLNIPDNINEFSKVNWHDKYNSMLDRLIEASTSSEVRYKKVSELIARDVITVIADAVDIKKNIHGSVESSIENDLRTLMDLVGIKEMDVKPGQVYNPELHELVIDNNKSMITDRQQKITKVISRGLILPDGKIKKAKVSIQR